MSMSALDSFRAQRNQARKEYTSQVVDQDSVPPLAYKERLTTKNAQFYCVRFFPTDDLSVPIPIQILMLTP
jgi:hypothetical protein